MQIRPRTTRESFTSEHFFKLVKPYDAGASGSTLGKDMVNRSVRYVNERSPSDWALIRNDDPQAILELSLKGSLKVITQFHFVPDFVLFACPSRR